MNGLVLAEVKQTEIEDENDPRIVLRFEILPSSKAPRVKLFEVVHRRDFPYPALIVEPSELPTYLRRRYYSPGISESISLMTSMSSLMSKPGEWVENENVCATPQEFVRKLGQVLASTEIKSAVMSVLARSQEELEEKPLSVTPPPTATPPPANNGEPGTTDGDVETDKQ
ncbi:hypothetical protein [Novipirellula rosea]